MAYILIADDDTASRELLRFTLTSLGHEVTAVDNGVDALKSARERYPDLIISDILMPELDGFDLCREIKRDGKLTAIPFIFYTATYVTDEDEKLAMSYGGSGFIRKGSDAAEFVAVINQAISQSLDQNKPAPHVLGETFPELDKQHEAVVTKKLTKKMTELQLERKQHLESLELLDAVFNAAVSAIIAMDAEGKVLVWNKSAVTMFGYEASEAMGTNLHDLIMPEQYRERMQQGLQHFLSTGEGAVLGKVVELTGRRKDNSTFPIALSVSGFQRNGEWYAAATVRDISQRKAMEGQKRMDDKALKEALLGTIESIATALAQRDAYTSGHQKRVALLAVAIGVELGLSEHDLEGLRLGALIHDIGKISVPAEMLSKPGKLTDIEYRLIQEHARSGYEVVKDVAFPWPIAEMILQHHERLDGSGYPQALAGDAIIMEARILAVADVVEAMSSHRPYRPSLGMEAALAFIGSGRGTLFDARVVDRCINLIREKSFTFA